MGLAGVVLYDSLSTRIDKRPDNPWQYDVEEFKSVDEELLSHIEVRRIEIDEPVALAWQNGKLFLLAGNSLQIITPEGRELLNKRIDHGPRSIWVGKDENIIVAYENYLVMYDGSGDELKRSSILDDESLISSIAISDDIIFAADAGKRSAWKLNNELEVMDEF